ncbi:MAG: hypothetical protein LUD15_12715 [Bacteroides sp.]|nr:hypothetical protein [Bacteroides sp.]
MLYYLKKYPFSLLVVAIVLYLSFFRPPSTGLDKIPNLDKVAHIGMYFGLSFMLWLEFFRNHQGKGNMIHAWTGAFLCPILLGGVVEVLQAYCTKHRGGEWLDFAANSIEALLGALFSLYILRPWYQKHIKNR